MKAGFGPISCLRLTQFCFTFVLFCFVLIIFLLIWEARLSFKEVFMVCLSPVKLCKTQMIFLFALVPSKIQILSDS